MSDSKIDYNFIQELTNETLKMTARGSVSLTDQIKGHIDSYWGLKHIPELKIFRLNIADYSIDIPTNWSIFELLAQSYKGHRATVLVVPNNDNDKLVDLFSGIVGERSRFAFVVARGKCLLVKYKNEDQERALKDIVYSDNTNGDVSVSEEADCSYAA